MEKYLLEFERWKSTLPKDGEEYLALEEMEKNRAFIEDCFYKELTFGTSGLRGIMGVGTNRMNKLVVSRATRGLCRYAHKKQMSDRKLSFIIAYDSRKNSKKFAEEAARIISENGDKAIIFRDIAPIPLLSYVIGQMKADYGIMITASHNHKSYNGYKVYSDRGYQILDEEAEGILAEIEKLDILQDCKNCENRSSHISTENIEYVDARLEENFLNDIVRELGEMEGDLKQIKIVYSPLNGTGADYVRKLMKASEVNMIEVQSQWEADGEFQTCPYPNPERKEVYDEGIKIMKEEAADALLLTDPDSDRMGIATSEGILSGNEIAILMAYYLCEQIRRQGCSGEEYRGYKSIVSTPIIDKILHRDGIEMQNTLVGFKYMGKAIDEAAMKEKKLILAFEEGNGYLAFSKVRDKDGISSLFLMCKILSFYKAAGMTLQQTLKRIYAEFGIHREYGREYIFEGSKGEADMKNIMKYLRGNQKEIMKKMDAAYVRDYKHKTECLSCDETSKEYEDNLPISDTIEIGNKGYKLIIRPSGTEPKLKCYLMIWGEDEDNIGKMKNDMLKSLDEIVKGRLQNEK